MQSPPGQPPAGTNQHGSPPGQPPPGQPPPNQHGSPPVRHEAAPAAEPEEQVIYEGRAQLPIKQLVLDVLACLIVIGLVMLPWHWFINRTKRYRITTRQIRTESGVITRRTEVMDLWKVRDVQLESTFGRDTVVIYSTDTTTPVLRLQLPNGRQVFENLQLAVPAARRGAGVVLHQG